MMPIRMIDRKQLTGDPAKSDTIHTDERVRTEEEFGPRIARMFADWKGGGSPRHSSFSECLNFPNLGKFRCHFSNPWKNRPEETFPHPSANIRAIRGENLLPVAPLEFLRETR
jgi:hypothetical protein